MTVTVTEQSPIEIPEADFEDAMDDLLTDKVREVLEGTPHCLIGARVVDGDPEHVVAFHVHEGLDDDAPCPIFPHLSR